jgi:hypothetical protein
MAAPLACAGIEYWQSHRDDPVSAHLPQPAPGPARECFSRLQRDPLARSTRSLHFSFATIRILAVVGLAIAFFFPDASSRAQAPGEDGKKPGKQEHMVFDFRTDIKQFPSLSLRGADTESVAKTDDKGLRITMPAGRRDVKLVVVEWLHRIGGDFAITLGYELLAVGDPPPNNGAGVRMRVWFDAPSSLCAHLSRSRKPTGDVFGCSKSLKGPDGAEKFSHVKSAKATRSRGKIRVVRTARQLEYLVAEEGQDFRPIQLLEIGTDNVIGVQVICTTMFKPITLDLRLTELDIQADKIQIGEPLTNSEPPLATPEKAESRGWFVVELIGLGITFVMLAALGAWLYARQRRRAEPMPARDPLQESPGESSPAVPAVSFPCSACGKNLKARAELAGKKVKCTHCGQSALVPKPRADDAGQISA